MSNFLMIFINKLNFVQSNFYLLYYKYKKFYVQFIILKLKNLDIKNY